jgi:hypothetical protein|nr:MAG TPA: hypothetical protein [Caudoviricetes sp.]
MIKKLISILTSCILAGSLMVGCSEDTTKNLDEKGKQALATTKKEEHDYKKVTELTLSNDYEDEYVEITGTVKEFKTEYNTMIITLDFEKAILPVYVHIPKNMVDVKFEVGDTIIAYGRCCGLRKRSDERYFQINAYFLSKTPIIKKEQSNQNKENKANSKSADNNNKLENNNQSTNTTKKVQQTKKKTVNEEKQQKEKTKPYVDEKNNVYVDEDGNRQPLVKHDHMTEEYDKQPKCPECGYPVDDCHCNGDGNTVDEEDDNYNWDYYDEPMDEDSWNINNDEQQEQEETPAQQDNNQ